MILKTFKYLFVPGIAGAGTVTIIGEKVYREQLLSIYNITRKKFIYTDDPDIIGKGGIFSYGSNDTIITLEYDTSTYNTGDVLRISVCDDITQSRTYSAAISGLSTALLATDIFTITGANGITGKILEVGVGGVRSVAGTANLTLIKRSSINSGGSSSVVPAVPHDSDDIAASSVVRAYTSNPTPGATVGNIRATGIFFGTLALNTTSDEHIFRFDSNSEPPLLRSANEVIAINLAGVTILGASLNLWITWTEE